MIFLPTPGRLTGTEQEQINTLRSFLCRLVGELERQINAGLEEVEESVLQEVMNYVE